MSKAYDRVEWAFLEAIIEKMGFSRRWVSLVMNCVVIVRYMIVHGANEKGPIIPTRWLRQGDPISPYLFLICAEGFSTLVRRYEDRGQIRGCKVARHASVVSHMLFADDCYLFCKANGDKS